MGKILDLLPLERRDVYTQRGTTEAAAAAAAARKYDDLHHAVREKDFIVEGLARGKCKHWTFMLLKRLPQESVHATLEHLTAMSFRPDAMENAAELGMRLKGCLDRSEASKCPTSPT
eukprot:3217440-Amphidinium_carterae.1